MTPAPPWTAELQLGIPHIPASLNTNCPAEKRPEHKGWYSRGYLPHCDHPGLLQFITYRLADSLPREVLERMQCECNLSLILKGGAKDEKLSKHCSMLATVHVCFGVLKLRNA